jgi:KRAB domain-containing zinc finger protein
MRKYRKLLPEERKINRGIRRAKECIKINTADLYKNELDDIYTDQPEYLQILAEDKLPDGIITDRIKLLFEPTTWQSYSWSCDYCTEPTAFTDIMQLNDHLHKAHKTKYKRRCSECQRTTHHFAAYINHIIENHSSHNKFCCILCQQVQIRWSLKDLFIHYQSEHAEQKIFFCLYCGLHFIGGAKLKEHLINKHKRSTEEDGKFECDICGWSTDMRHKMKQHMIKHTSQLTFMCDQCTVTFATSSYLSTHIKQVHSRIEISCTKCDKLFKSERRLRVHDKAVHQDNKQFLCHICHKAFYAQHRLNSHLKIHQDALDERFQCPYCERRFKYKPGMNYHIRWVLGY